MQKGGLYAKTHITGGAPKRDIARLLEVGPQRRRPLPLSNEQLRAAGTPLGLDPKENTSLYTNNTKPKKGNIVKFDFSALEASFLAFLSDLFIFTSSPLL